MWTKEVLLTVPPCAESVLKFTGWFASSVSNNTEGGQINSEPPPRFYAG